MGRRTKSPEPRNYYRKDGFVYVADHVTKTVDCPQSADKEDYPEEVKKHIDLSGYAIQLTIE